MKRLLSAVLLSLALSTPAQAKTFYAQGYASYYDCGPGQCSKGAVTSSGEAFDPNAMTCAMPRLRLGAIVSIERLRYTAKNKPVVVGKAWCRVNDHGPWVPGRIIDLTPKVKKKLGMGDLGYVRIYVIR